MRIDENGSLYRRLFEDKTHENFVGKWLTDLDKIDLSNPVVTITNGWQSSHQKNQWYADALAHKVSMFSYDSRGQGKSPQKGELNAIQGAIDANYMITKSFNEYDKKAAKAGIKPGNKILQGNCAGTMSLAALFARNLPASKKIDGTILISPVSTFSLPLPLRFTYFLPIWFVNFAIKKIAPAMTKMTVPGDKSEDSRKEGLSRLDGVDPRVLLKQAQQIFWKENVSKYWSSIKVPSLILVSRNDPMVKLQHSYEAFDKLPYPIWYELEAPDHLILEDNIEFLSKLLPDFSKDPWGFYEENKDRSPY